MAFDYPILPDSTAQRDFQETFGGYNHNLRISDSEFYDMKNMTGDYYPVLSPRRKRGLVQPMVNPKALLCKDALCYIDGNHLYINYDEIEAFASSHSDSGSYVMVGMGAYLVVFEKTAHGLENGWYVNTVDTSDCGTIDNVVELTLNRNTELEYSTCEKDGGSVAYSIGVTEPSNPANGERWLDTSSKPHCLKIWSGTTRMWSTVLTTYVKLSAPGIAEGFKEGDAVEITGCEVIAHEGGNAVLSSTSEQIKSLNATAIIQSLDTESNGWIVVIGIVDQVVSQTSGTVTIARKAPYMDYICECNNRLWGCRYGLNRADETVNEIYACKQGDFKNWRCYAGISTDSYSASVGSDGVWTGAVHYGKEVLFFKENCIHKLYGNMPADYQLLELKHRGLQRGSEKSIVCVNETLFYKTASDIVYYDGSLPVSISYPLGEHTFYNAAAGSLGNKYYISMQDENGEWGLYVYDISKQLWHKEDALHVTEFCRVDNSLYAITAAKNLIDLAGTGATEHDFEWYAQTGRIGYSYSDNKYVGRMLVRLSKPLTSEITLLIRYDDSTKWETVSRIAGSGTRSFSIPVLPRRCDNFSLRIEGRGDCKIYSISKVLDVGSDIS